MKLSTTEKAQFYMGRWDETLEEMICNELLILDAAQKEIEVSDGEVRQELEDRFGFFAISTLNGIEAVAISYPVVEYPEKVTSFNFDKSPVVEGTLLGIKGQYLIFDSGVINLRRFSGYEIAISN